MTGGGLSPEIRVYGEDGAGSISEGGPPGYFSRTGAVPPERTLGESEEG